MRPLGYGNRTLEALTPTLRIRPEGERWAYEPPPHGHRRPFGIPVDTESDDGSPGTSFMGYWEPNWRDLWDLLRGRIIRVTVNYSLYGPLDIDVVKRDSPGIPGRRLDW